MIAIDGKTLRRSHDKKNHLGALHVVSAWASEVRYYLSSLKPSVKRFARAVRSHWSIENSLHWVLDVTFDEDQSRSRNRRLAENLAALRRIAVSLLKQHPAKQSIKGKQRSAGWNNSFLAEVLALQTT